MIYRLIATLLLLTGTLLSCTTAQEEAPQSIEGPALVMFYTDS